MKGERRRIGQTLMFAVLLAQVAFVFYGCFSGAEALEEEYNRTFGGFSANETFANVIQPSDLTYLGAFRLPGGDTPPQTFAYGGNAMTFNPDGDFANTDQHPGSLFVMGHDRQAWGALPNGSQVAELSIPVPVNSTNLDDLPYATFIQGFHDVAAGYFHDLDEVPKVGMQYLNHPDTGPKIHLCWGRHLQQLEDDIPSHAWINATLATPDLQGVWYIDNRNPNSVNGYLFDIPAAWADAYAQGRYLATGRVHGGGLGGMGPALVAYRPWLGGGVAPANGTHLADTPLLLYENAYHTSEIIRCMTGYQHPDEWEGGAWLTTPSGKSAVLFAGTKSTGTKYWYGYLNSSGPQYPCVDTAMTDFVTCRLANGTPCPPEDFAGCCDEDAGTCSSYRGWWSTRFDAQLILYDPADLARVAAGTLNSWEPQPYATIDIDDHLYFNPPEWDEIDLGTGDQRRYRIGDATYDRVNGFLYVLELYADGAKPVVHVWSSFVIPHPVITSCNSSGTEINAFLPGDSVYVQGSGLEPSTQYKIWLQDNPVSEGDSLVTEEDDSGSQENVTTNESGNFGPTEIWTIPGGAPITHHEYDIVVDKQSDGENTGKYNAASDGIDSATAGGIIAPVQELPTMLLYSLGALVLTGYVWQRRRNRSQ